MNICKVPDCPELAKQSNYCPKHYKRWYRYGDPIVTKRFPNSTPIRERIETIGWDVQDNGCWLWRGRTGARGYGQIDYQNKSHTVTRLIYELYKGVKPVDGISVCHICDNPICVNPDHLFLGTQKDNARDMLSKGRNNPLSGQASHLSKLTEEQAIDVKRRYLNGDSPTKIGLDFGIDKVHVWRIGVGKSWSYLD